MKYISAILFFLFFFTTISFGQNITIKGKAIGAEGLKIKLISYADYISELPKKLDETYIDNNGNFQLKTSINEVIYVQLQIGFLKDEMYLEPGKSYDIEIQSQSYKEDEKESPFLSKEKLKIVLLNQDSLSLNVLISKFNILFNDFVLNNFKSIYNRRDKRKIDTLNSRITEMFGSSKNVFFKNYIKYKIAGLELPVKSRNKIFSLYLINKPILYNHIEYMYFFNEFYEKFFLNGSHFIKIEDLKRYINVERNYISLLDSLGKDSLVKNEVIRELVFLKGMKEIYYSKNYNNDNIIDILSRFSNKTKFQEHKKIAQNLIETFIALKPGIKAPDFVLRDLSGNNYSLSNFAGKYTYICFFTTWCAGCLAENEAIAKLKIKYEDKINFVFISADKQSLNLHYFLEKNKYNWFFLYSENDKDVFDSYGVKSFPVFILLDNQGKIINYPALKPSEGIEIIFNQLFKKENPNSNDN